MLRAAISQVLSARGTVESELALDNVAAKPV